MMSEFSLVIALSNATAKQECFRERDLEGNSVLKEQDA
jgi:hypothetical protein